MQRSCGRRLRPAHRRSSSPRRRTDVSTGFRQSAPPAAWLRGRPTPLQCRLAAMCMTPRPDRVRPTCLRPASLSEWPTVPRPNARSRRVPAARHPHTRSCRRSLRRHSDGPTDRRPRSAWWRPASGRYELAVASKTCRSSGEPGRVHRYLRRPTADLSCRRPPCKISPRHTQRPGASYLTSVEAAGLAVSPNATRSTAQPATSYGDRRSSRPRHTHASTCKRPQ